MIGKVKMPYHNLNVHYDSDRILKEIFCLEYKPLVQHIDGKTYPNWLLADLPKDSYTIRVCDEIVALFETRLQTPARALRFAPPQINNAHTDGPLARGVINIVIEDGFKLEIEDTLYDLHTSIFDVKKMHRLVDIHSTIHLIRIDVISMYSELLETGIKKNLLKD